MGLDKYKRTPCGFCFVEYYQRPDKYMNYFQNLVILEELSWDYELEEISICTPVVQLY